MPHIMLFFIGFLFLGCGTELSTMTKNINSKSTIENIEGNYTLKKGIYSYNEDIAINKVVNASSLVIEKLDSDDYGYYFTMQVENLTPTEEVGIFHKDGDSYFTRLIYSTDITKDSNISIDSKISDEHLETDITDKVALLLKDNTLKISNMKMKNGGEITIIWDRDENSSISQDPKLKDAKHEYIKAYRDRFLEYFKD